MTRNRLSDRLTKQLFQASKYPVRGHFCSVSTVHQTCCSQNWRQQGNNEVQLCGFTVSVETVLMQIVNRRWPIDRWRGMPDVKMRMWKDWSLEIILQLRLDRYVWYKMSMFYNQLDNCREAREKNDMTHCVKGCRFPQKIKREIIFLAWSDRAVIFLISRRISTCNWQLKLLVNECTCILKQMLNIL